MFLGRRTVSRKTPGDGKLEIPEDAARPILALGAPITVAAGGDEAAGSVATMECTCGKRAGGRHTHWFLESEVLRTLQPESEVRLDLDEAAGRIAISAGNHPVP